MVCEEEKLLIICRLHLLGDDIIFLELLVTAHPQGLGRELFEVAVPCKEENDRVIVDRLLLFLLLFQVGGIDDFTLPGLAILLADLLEFFDDDFLDPAAVIEDILEILDFSLKVLHILQPFQDILPV